MHLAEIDELRARVAQLEESTRRHEEASRRQAIETTQLLDQRIAEYMQQHGHFPSSTVSGGSPEH